MANIFNADNGATSGSAGVKISSDGSNSLAIQTNNVTAITIDANQNANFVSTGTVTIPVGTTAERPGTPAAGAIRFNSNTTVYEGYTGSGWANLSAQTANITSVSDQNNAATGYLSIPLGTTAQRPSSPQLGSMRWNSNTSTMEVYVGGSLTWANIASTTGSAVTYTVSYLAIAGGGGGGSNYAGGGGGGGGYVYGVTTVTPGVAYTITIGAGGTGSAGAPSGVSGGNTTFSTFTAIGGGGGGSYDNNTAPGLAGGSGGGGGGLANNYGPGGAGTSGQGYAGGTGYYYTPGPASISAGGGGGAQGKGGDGTTGRDGYGGNGGAGIYFETNGVGAYYCGGGGAGGCGYAPYATYAGSAQSVGGGGPGGRSAVGTSGTTNSGGGGGGAGMNSGAGNYNGGNGGSGYFTIKYDGPQRGTGGTVTYDGVTTTHVFTTSGTYTA